MQPKATRGWHHRVFLQMSLAGLLLPLALFAAPVVLGKAEQPPQGGTVEVKGTVEAFEQADLYTRVTGTVQTCNVDIGDRVKKGDVLAELYVPDLQVELLQKEALLLQTKARVVQAKETVSVMEAIASAAKSQMEEAKVSLQKVKADQDKWKAEFHLFQKKAAYLEFAARRNKALADVSAAETGVAMAQADVKGAQALVEFARVLAPFDGVVIRRTTFPGNLAGPPKGKQDQPLFTVVSIYSVRVVAQIPEANALAVTKGTLALVRFPALKGKQFATKVTRTAFAIDPKTATLRIEMLLDNSKELLRPGLSANVALRLPAEEPKKKTP